MNLCGAPPEAAPERAMRLLARHAGIANANLYTELVLGDADAVETRLKANPAIARQRGGVQNWEPLLYVCHTFLQKDSPERAKELVRITRELLRMRRIMTGTGTRSCHGQLSGER